MSLNLQPLPIPLRQEPSGTIRVGNTRIDLEIVLADWKNGLTPEQIAAGYPTLTLADVYAVLAYYLRHKKEVEEYLRWGDEQAAAVRRRIEAVQPPLPEGLRARLEAARASREGQADVPAAAAEHDADAAGDAQGRTPASRQSV